MSDKARPSSGDYIKMTPLERAKALRAARRNEGELMRLKSSSGSLTQQQNKDLSHARSTVRILSKLPVANLSTGKTPEQTIARLKVIRSKLKPLGGNSGLLTEEQRVRRRKLELEREELVKSQGKKPGPVQVRSVVSGGLPGLGKRS